MLLVHLLTFYFILLGTNVFILAYSIDYCFISHIVKLRLSTFFQNKEHDDEIFTAGMGLKCKTVPSVVCSWSLTVTHLNFRHVARTSPNTCGSSEGPRSGVIQRPSSVETLNKK